MTLTIKQDKKRKWRWSLKAKNGRIIGASSQGYRHKADCYTNLRQVCAGLIICDSKSVTE